MTDYGRGSGSEPWHPEDPLFGDGYEQGYPQQPQAPQQPQTPQQGGWDDPYATGRHQQYPQQGQPQQQYPQQGQPQQQPYPQQGGPQQQYPQQQYPQQGQQYPQQGRPQYPQQQYDGYDTGSHPVGGYGSQDPYGGHQPQDPYATGVQPDFYGQHGYPPPQQPQYRQQPVPGQPQPQQPQPGQQYPQPGQQQPAQAARPQRPAPAELGEWDAEVDADAPEHAFFANRHDDDEDDDAPATTHGSGGRRAGKSQAKSGKKRRSGCACLAVVLVLAGGLGGVGYFGYTFYESHFGPAPDYSGQGAGDVQVEIPQGSTITTMGNILKTAGVVKSVDAFTAAARKNPKGQFIQAGVYALRKDMAAAAAVTMMLDPTSQNAMIIPEGWRATRIYQAIDVKLKLKAGTTAAAVKNTKFDLPAWAHGNIEGFLFPAKYSIASTMKPLDVVRKMVNQAKAEYTNDDLETAAGKAGKSPADILKIASLVQAEAQEDGDFGKVSRVVYNRLDKSMALGFDSTLNYAMGRSTLNTSNKDTRYPSPYNTYTHKGLPPGPIDNPGHQAIEAALNPTAGNWLYFVTVKKGDTRFTDSYAEHQKNVQAFNQYQKDHSG